jgi:hypothetical protein
MRLVGYLGRNEGRGYRRVLSYLVGDAMKYRPETAVKSRPYSPDSVAAALSVAR